MVIDDDLFDSMVMEKIFSEYYQVSIAENVQDFYCKYRKIRPQVIYYELRTPCSEMLQEIYGIIKSKPYMHPHLIIAATENTYDIEQFARINGVFYYLIRPFNLKELWDALESAFRDKEKKERCYRHKKLLSGNILVQEKRSRKNERK